MIYRCENTYILLKPQHLSSEMEIDNIVRIVEAVRYGMDPSEIMQLLVII